MTGVLIDDLITSGAEEPYRMFTSRSEFRLINRAENSDFRLTQKAIDIGIISEDQTQAFYKKKEEKEKTLNHLKNFKLTSQKWNENGLNVVSNIKTEKVSADKILSYPGVSIEQVENIC